MYNYQFMCNLHSPFGNLYRRSVSHLKFAECIFVASYFIYSFNLWLL